MFCTKCGNQVEDSQQFCTKCGQQVNAADGSVRQQESAPKTKSTITAKIIEGVIFVALAAAFFGYKYYTDATSPWQIKKQTAQLIEQCVNKSEMAKSVQFVKVEDIDLDKQDRNHYSGTAWVWLKNKANAAMDPARFKYVLNVVVEDDQIKLSQKIHQDDLQKLVMFMLGGAEEESNDDKEPENSTEEPATESDEDRTISSFLGFEFGKDINKLCSDCMMNSSKEHVLGRAKLKKPFRMFEAGAWVDFEACPTTKRMYKLSIGVGIPDVAVRKREYEKCRDIIQKKYGIKPKESGEDVFGGIAEATSEFVVGNVAILLKMQKFVVTDTLYKGGLTLSATNTQLEKEAKEEYNASLPSGDDSDAL